MYSSLDTNETPFSGKIPCATEVYVLSQQGNKAGAFSQDPDCQEIYIAIGVELLIDTSFVG